MSTKAKFDVWNQNEVKFTNMTRCITCWDQALVSTYDAPNHFWRTNLQSDKGKARIDGLQSSVCPGSVANPLLGVAAKVLEFGPTLTITAGTNVPGMGTYFVQSIQNLDRGLIMAVVLVFSGVVILFNLIIDILYAIVDPRIKVTS